MKLLKKSVIILCTLFILRTFTGCFTYDCPDDVYTFDFKKLVINNLDNSGKWPSVLKTDTMNKAAVAFQLFLASDLPYFAHSGNKIQGFGFSNTFAFSKTYCPTYYISNQEVKSISVITRLEISAELPANSVVSDLFLGNDETGWYETNLYLPLESLSHKINHTYIDEQAVQFRLFLNRTIENDSAQFIVNVNFADNSIISDTTNLIHIR
jgi:hypothetical protein